MKASILAVTISSLISTQVLASSAKVDVELANSYTNQIINEQLNDINASVQAQLNAQYAHAAVGTTTVVEDVVYEKQSNGTWAAIGGVSATLIAGLLSSSSSSSNNDDSNIPPVLSSDLLAMDHLGAWETDSNGSGYVMTVAGESIYVSAENVVDNGNGTATITVDDKKLTVGINGDTFYWVDQVEHPEVEAPEFGSDRPEMEERDFTVKINNGEIHIIDANTSEWVGTVQPKDGELVFIGNGDFQKTLLKVEGDLEANGSAAIVKSNGEWVATIERVDNGFELTGKNGTIVVNSPRPSLPASPAHPDIDPDDTPRWAPEFGDDRPEMEERDFTVKIINGEIHIIDANTSEWVGTVQPKDGELVFIGNGDFQKTLLKVEGDLEANGSAAIVKGNGEWVATIERVDNGFELTGKNGTIVVNSPRPNLPTSPAHPDIDPDDTPRWALEFGGDRPEMEERDFTVKIINGEIHIIDANTSEWVGTVQPKDGELVFIGNGDFQKTLLKVEGDINSDQFALVKGNGQWVATVSKVENGIRVQTKKHDRVFDGSKINRSKLQNIDSSKLQRAKSVIQQRIGS
ncbi:hypothetical protein NM22_10795 [Vibrio tubiashii]|nr:hypothetical protein NM22_10795 [Vibrio tubiashii]